MRELGEHLASCHCAFALFLGALVAIAAGAISRAQAFTIEVVSKDPESPKH